MKNILFLIITVALLVGLFFVFKPENQTQDTGVKEFRIQIQNRKIISGGETLNVLEGDQVTIKILTDEVEEFHLHGYDRSVDLESDKETQLVFTANLTGRFEFELEKSKTNLGMIEVQPK